MKRVSLAAFTFALLSSAPAFALDEIYSPNAEKGELSIGYNGSRTFDNDSALDNAQNHAFSVEYGATDRLMLEASMSYAKDPGADTKLDGYEIEGRYQLVESGAYWMDAGILGAYEYTPGYQKPDAVEVKLLLQKDTGPLTHTTNIGFEQAVGGHSAHTGGPEYSFLWNSRWRASEYAQPGLEIQSGLGQGSELRHFNEQEHYIGPALYGKLFGHVKYQAAYLFGVSDASADGAARILVEYETHF